MKILLIKDVKSIGKKGEIKEVSFGYAKNFLIPKGYAKEATEEVLKSYEEEQKRLQEEKEKEIIEFNKAKELIESKQITITKKLGKNGHLYGAVTKEDVKEALQKEGINIDKKNVNFKKTIKEVGDFEIEIKLGHGIKAKLKAIVKGE